MVVNMTWSIVDNEKNFAHFGTSDIRIESPEVEFKKGSGHPCFFVVKVKKAMFGTGFAFKRTRLCSMPNVKGFPAIRSSCVNCKSDSNASFVLLSP
jgi:hypothetical protein